MFKKVVLFFTAAFFVTEFYTADAKMDSLAHLTKDNKPIRVFIKGCVNESGQSQLNMADFKKSIEEALTNRKSFDFDIADTPEGSDIQIVAIVKKYQYLERGPLKISPSVGGMVLDAAATATAHYGELTSEFVIEDSKTKAILWNGTVEKYIKKDIASEEMLPQLYDKVTRAFLGKSFGKSEETSGSYQRERL